MPSPIAHIGGSIYAFECPLLLGTTAVLMDRWDPDEAVALMASQRCTHMAGATPFLEELLAAAERAGTRLPDLKVFICGGASVPPSLIRSAAAYFEQCRGHPGIRLDGGARHHRRLPRPTRTTRPTPTAGRHRRRQAVATTPPRRDRARSVRADRRCWSATAIPRTSATLSTTKVSSAPAISARWVDGDCLVVTGRAKDIIIRSGENIAPKEVEDILAGHPDIAEIAIVGLPDARTGERACAVIVPAAAARPRRRRACATSWPTTASRSSKLPSRW